MDEVNDEAEQIEQDDKEVDDNSEVEDSDNETTYTCDTMDTEGTVDSSVTTGKDSGQESAVKLLKTSMYILVSDFLL